MGGILVEADILTVLIVLIDETEYRMRVKETARVEVIPTAETEVAGMPRLISAELLIPVHTKHPNVICGVHLSLLNRAQSICICKGK